MHVAIVTPWETKGGISTYSDRLADSLRKEGVDVTPVPIQDPQGFNPASFYHLPEPIPDDADVVHLQFEAGVFGRVGVSGVWAPLVMARLARDDRPVVTTIHEVFEEHSEVGFAGKAVLRVRDFVLERAILQSSEITVVHTRQSEEILRRRHGDYRIERLLHPVEADAEPISSSAAKAELELTGPVALTFGWVEPKKRYEEVISLLPSFPELTYVIAGQPRTAADREKLSTIQDMADRLDVADQLEYLGYVSDEMVPTVFSATDVVVLPYERVTQSGVVNLALAYERPVVTTDLPAFRELDSEFGCLLTYSSEAELESTLRNVLSDDELRNTLVQNAQTYADEVTWERFARQTAEYYAELLA